MILRALALAIFAAAIATAPLPASAQSNDIIAHGKARTVFITYSYTDQNGTRIDGNSGSGVLVSRHGHVLTAYHVIRDWVTQPQGQKANNKIFGSIGSIYATQLELLSPTDFSAEQGDYAILRFGLPRGEGYPAASICFYGDVSELSDQKFTAFGFPRRQEIQPVPGLFGSSSGPAGTWSAQSSFARGMSGGPVFDSRASLIGIIRSSAAESDALHHVTPIVRMQAGLLNNNIKADCGSGGGPLPNPGRPPDNTTRIPANCTEVLFSDNTVFPPKTEKQIIFR